MKEEIPFLALRIAGTKFRCTKDEVRQFVSPGDFVKLEREPKNEFDSNAIACYLGVRHVGYVPAAVAKYYAPLLDVGLELAGRVLSTQPDLLIINMQLVWVKEDPFDPEEEFVLNESEED